LDQCTDLADPLAKADSTVNKRFQRGLVVGKFSPLHRGHELVIRRALDESAEVIVLSYSKPEWPGCEAGRRDRWFSKLFPQVRHIAITDERLQSWIEPSGAILEVPANNASENLHRRFCAFLCRDVLGLTVDAVFTSEDYGEGFAAELTRCFRERQSSCPSVSHIMVDSERRIVPISGTLLRQGIHGLREWLAPEVYASFVRRVCLLGGECTGKSTLAEILARKFGTVHVAEYGRELWEKKSGALTIEDLRQIAEVQVEREEAALLRAYRYLFCDTSPLTTLFYSLHLFGGADLTVQQSAHRSYDVTLLCAPDFPFVQDGTRQPEDFRLRQHEWYLAELNGRGVPFSLVQGSLENRLAQIEKRLDQDRLD
jgi:NadR type nicotinamide-nucleotide adenylyltransferase